MRNSYMVSASFLAVAVLAMIGCGGGDGGGGEHNVESRRPPERPEVHKPAAKTRSSNEAAELRKSSQRANGLNDSVDQAARDFASEILSSAVKSPSAATFPKDPLVKQRLDDVGTGESAVRRWHVSGAVDVPNSFGISERRHWDMQIAQAGEKFFPVTCRLDGKEVFSDPKHSNLVDRNQATDPEHAK